MKKILVTGTAGFIGYHLAKLLLAEGFRIHGYDGMTDYYDVTLKQRRDAGLLQYPGFSATEGMLEDQALLARMSDVAVAMAGCTLRPLTANARIRLPGNDWRWP